MQTGQPRQPIVSNGLPLTKLHHAAFDAHLIGIDPDYRIHVSDRLLEIHDGPFLELGLKGIAGTSIKLPRRSDDRPDRDRLARRFEELKRPRDGFDGPVDAGQGLPIDAKQILGFLRHQGAEVWGKARHRQ